MVSIENPSDQGGVSARQAGVAVEAPAGGQPIGMYYQKRPFGPGVGELLDLADPVPDGSVVGDHVAAAPGQNNDAANVPHPCKADYLMGDVHLGHRHGRTPRVPQGGVGGLDHRCRREVGFLLEHPHCLPGSLGCRQAVTQAINHQDQAAAGALVDCPPIAINLLAGLGQTDRSDLKRVGPKMPGISCAERENPRQ